MDKSALALVSSRKMLPYERAEKKKRKQTGSQTPTTSGSKNKTNVETVAVENVIVNMDETVSAIAGIPGVVLTDESGTQIVYQHDATAQFQEHVVLQSDLATEEFPKPTAENVTESEMDILS